MLSVSSVNGVVPPTSSTGLSQRLGWRRGLALVVPFVAAASRYYLPLYSLLLIFASAALVENGAPLMDGTMFREATMLCYSPNHIEVEVNLSAPGFLVLSEVWYPDWQATDNGEPVQIYRADGLLRGVYLEQGDHLMAFTYRPPSVRVGGVVSGLSFLALMGSLTWNTLRARRRAS